MRENKLKEIYKGIDSGTPSEKMKNLSAFPKIVEFEITNHCNFQCIMCPTGLGTARRDRGYMDDDVFFKVIDEIKEYPVALKFVGQGESLLHPNALKYFKEAKKRGIITHLTTNGSLLTEEMMKEIVDSELLDSIKFSFQGVNAEGYCLLRRKDAYDDLMKRIKTLYELRNEREKPFITIGTSVTNEDSDTIDAFIAYAQTICDKVEVGMTNLETSDLSYVKRKSDRDILVELCEKQLVKKRRYVCCPQVYDAITVRWNGDVTACCSDIHGLMTLGNIKKESIIDCWSGEKERAFRRLLSEGRYEDIEACKNCYDMYGWTYGEN